MKKIKLVSLVFALSVVLSAKSLPLKIELNTGAGYNYKEYNYEKLEEFGFDSFVEDGESLIYNDIVLKAGLNFKYPFYFENHNLLLGIGLDALLITSANTNVESVVKESKKIADLKDEFNEIQKEKERLLELKNTLDARKVKTNAALKTMGDIYHDILIAYEGRSKSVEKLKELDEYNEEYAIDDSDPSKTNIITAYSDAEEELKVIREELSNLLKERKEYREQNPDVMAKYLEWEEKVKAGDTNAVVDDAHYQELSESISDKTDEEFNKNSEISELYIIKITMENYDQFRKKHLAQYNKANEVLEKLIPEYREAFNSYKLDPELGYYVYESPEGEPDFVSLEMFDEEADDTSKQLAGFEDLDLGESYEETPLTSPSVLFVYPDDETALQSLNEQIEQLNQDYEELEKKIDEYNNKIALANETPSVKFIDAVNKNKLNYGINIYGLLEYRYSISNDLSLLVSLNTGLNISTNRIYNISKYLEDVNTKVNGRPYLKNNNIKSYELNPHIELGIGIKYKGLISKVYGGYNTSLVGLQIGYEF